MPELNQVYGIDLGTCNSAVARIDEFDQAVIVPNDINEPITPSVVYFESPDNVVVGVEAKSMAEIEPDRTVQFVKRFMGRKDEFAFEYNNRQYAPEEISAIILKALVEKAGRNVGKTITDVVITVPAYFDDAQRMATKNAGQMAGLNVLDIVNEPIAAAIAYGVRATTQKERILVYDLGGGTFDVTVIEVSQSGWRILVTGGRHLLGGVNWDDRLIIYVAQEFEREHGINPLTDPVAHQELRTKAESAKKRLSAKTKDPVTFSFESKKFRIELDRSKFEEITADLLDESIQATRETLDDLEGKTGSRHIDRLFLVGGSSRMPQVKTRVDAEFGIKSEIFDPDECVAKGAAIWAVKRKIDGLMQDVGGDKVAFAKALDKEIANVKNRQFYLSLPGKSGVNVSSHTYGIQAWLDGSPILAPLLQRNQEIPYSHVSGENGTMPFGTSEDNQATIDIVLMETDSDSLDPEQCKEIGRGTVELPPGVPRGSEVTILFDYAADGTMTLRAREVSTNSECLVNIDRDGVLDAEEVETGETHLQVISAR